MLSSWMLRLWMRLPSAVRNPGFCDGVLDYWMISGQRAMIASSRIILDKL